MAAEAHHDVRPPRGILEYKTFDVHLVGAVDLERHDLRRPIVVAAIERVDGHYLNSGNVVDPLHGDNLKGALNATEVDKQAGNYLSGRVGKMVGVVLSFVGVIFLVLIIYAGIKWMTSGATAFSGNSFSGSGCVVVCDSLSVCVGDDFVAMIHLGLRVHCLHCWLTASAY